MAVGDFSIIKESEIIGGDYSGAEFGVVWTSFRDYICAIRDKKKIVFINNEEVEYFVPLRAKGISMGASNLIEATVHGVLSTVIPGGALLGNAAAAAAGVASRSAATHAAGGIRNYRDVLVVFRDGKKALIRCADVYVKKIKKSCLRRKLTENEIDSIIDGKKEVAPKVALRNSSSECEEELDLKCKVCHKEISASDKFCSNCGAKIPSRARGTERKDIHEDNMASSGSHKKIRISSTVLIIGIFAVIVLIFMYIFSPPEQVISGRLDRVIDACNNNESSNKCKKLQSRYKIKFSYCYAYFDIPEIDKSIPVYAVAEREDFNKLSLVDVWRIDYDDYEVSPYYACTSYYSDLGKNIGNIADENIDSSQASYWLKNRPTVSFNPGLCQVSYSNLDSVLWGNIPNFEDTIYEARTEIESRQNYCFKKDNPRLAELYNSTDNKLRQYSENKIVREYYWGFDIWNENHSDSLAGCIYGKGSANEKRFRGECLTEVGEEGYPLSGFVDFMNARKESNYYKSRLLSR